MAGPRIAGDSRGYTFRMCRMVEGLAKPTKTGFELISVSTFLGDVLAKPPSAMAWWGFREGLKGVVELYEEDSDLFVAASEDAENLELVLKEQGVSPNLKRDAAGERGTAAHEVLENLVKSLHEPDALERAIAGAGFETADAGTEYGHAVLAWWQDQIEPHISSGAIKQVLSEVPVFSLNHRYAGTLDLAIEWSSEGEHDNVCDGWEIADLKTHKPASGHTKEGKGPAFIHDVAQNRAYRIAWEEMGLGQTIGNRVIVARDRAYRGARYLEDFREVPASFVIDLRRAYDHVAAFEKGDA